MKAIIIDDEQHVRDGLTLLAEWDRFNISSIFQAKDGEEAKSLILKHRPEIIFTDMNMPKVDGIELLKWIHNQEIHSKTIVVSGYDDFRYMRNAITYGSFDYILKPIEPDILNDTLERAVKEWKEEAKKRESTLENTRVMNEAKPLYWDHFFSSLLTKTKIDRETSSKIKREFKIDIQNTELTISLFSIELLEKTIFKGDKDLAFFTILNICNEVVSGDQCGVSFRNSYKEDEMVILLWKKQKVEERNKRIKEAIKEFSGITVLISIGETSISLTKTYQSACQTKMKRNLLTMSHEELVYDVSPSSQPLFHLFDYTEDIHWALQSGKIDQVDLLLEELFTTLKKDFTMSLEQIALWEDQFNQMRKNWLKEYKVNDRNVYEKRKNYWEGNGLFSYDKFKQEKKREFHDLIRILCEVKYKKEKSNIQEIEQYIRKNYDKDLTLQGIAERFFLSREHISRRFKQEYHDTVTNYLTTIRIEKAKELLENPFLKVYEVSSKVGYQNEKYFSKVFKKVVGVTPNEYRAEVSKG
ncbi:response regulator transcription factor [Bacillus weihaiensis]|uniref:response regulator transcription factor n=1 Tax=Bacillus weihaiensis TaxID=1547283 RepID=UPI002353AA4A|nr:response regulator [Bacillus weihaiensis]